ncbi:ATP-binding cassette domain-containing protein [Tengunoibacter tsumagoiensis]|uniref:Energy-coupling factor transporter ATP-binding protein EcfA n=1 Tax=Tengunoibacter tsumagoiensis TaxID=2014871 RepID=A0A402A1Q7_9CHLR|nr:ATP-binding cassette domain-containing protein [Tengunoibacter tsumagoiensis]GCE12992.1 energy-coupling factor transporter ATP-binding protein EcfA [Tengunoibacter tsumagoiensis]
MTRTPLIDIQQASYAYPLSAGAQSQVQALVEVNLRIEQGEYVALLGHNGSGKSTLARLCNALLLPDSGRVFVAGMLTSQQQLHSQIRERIGMIFQSPDNQLIATVVEDDVAWSLARRGFTLPVIRERVDEALRAVNIAHLRWLPPHKLSGGQKQRVAIAGILALRPDCIIADEATAALDPIARQEIIDLLFRLHQEYGLTILHVTHLLEETIRAQRVLLMEQGRIVQEDTPARIFADLERLQALKLAIPEPFVLATRLRKAGIHLSEEAMSLEAMARELHS